MAATVSPSQRTIQGRYDTFYRKLTHHHPILQKGLKVKVFTLVVLRTRGTRLK